MDQCSLLLSYVLQTLRKCFLSDKGQFLTKERFDSLLQPLTDQVSPVVYMHTDRQTDTSTVCSGTGPLGQQC